MKYTFEVSFALQIRTLEEADPNLRHRQSDEISNNNHFLSEPCSQKLIGRESVGLRKSERFKGNKRFLPALPVVTFVTSASLI